MTKLLFVFIYCWLAEHTVAQTKAQPEQHCACQKNETRWSAAVSLLQHRRLGYGLGISRNTLTSSRGLGGTTDYYAEALYFPTYQNHQQAVYGAKIGYFKSSIILGIGGELLLLHNKVNTNILVLPQVGSHTGLLEIKYGYAVSLGTYQINQLGRHTIVFKHNFTVFRKNNFEHQAKFHAK